MVQRLAIMAVYLCSVSCLAFSQVGTASIQVLSGGNLSYVFNSIAKYKNGITDVARTVVGITVNDNGNAAYSQWTLTIEFADADGDGQLTGASHTLPFSTVEVSTTLAGCAGCTQLAPVAPPYLVMTNAPQNLVYGGDGPGGADDIPPNYVFSSDQVKITYYIGTNGTLLGNPADFYTDDIILTLTVQ